MLGTRILFTTKFPKNTSHTCPHANEYIHFSFYTATFLLVTSSSGNRKTLVNRPRVVVM